MECRDDPLMADESSTPNVDSRQYRFAYEIHSRSDVPSDFAATLPSDHWQAALFMPGDTEAFWKPPEYAPQIYVLKRNRLLIYPHPTSEEELFEVPLDHLLAVELQKSLLYGIVQFHAANTSKRLRYSTVHQRLFDRFLLRLRSQWLATARLNHPVVAIDRAVHRSCARCVHALEFELDVGEHLHEQYCQPAVHLKERVWLFRRSRTVPALLVAITDRRVLAISTGAGDRNDPYELAIRYTSLQGLAALEMVRTQRDSSILRIRLKNNTTWNYAVPYSRPTLSRLIAIANESASSPGRQVQHTYDPL